MSLEQLGPNDYGLTDPQVLETATHIAPALFLALRVAHILDVSHYPIYSTSAVEAVVRAVSSGPDEFTHAGMKITVAGAQEHFPKELLPIVDPDDLLRKLYQAILIAHRASAQVAWAKIQTSGASCSHPMPTEGF